MTRKQTPKRLVLAIASLTLGSLAASASFASSHREAPFITEMPKVDGTDFYMFRSYETGREGFVTLIANYLPLQDAYGGPNYFDLDEDAIYEIHIDNDGDAVEDLAAVEGAALGPACLGFARDDHGVAEVFSGCPHVVAHKLSLLVHKRQVAAPL